jgi:hypothetical protein
MGRYITPTNVLARYQQLTDVHSQSNIDSSFIPYAEAQVEAMLSPKWIAPFSSNNITAQDLSIDMTILKTSVLKSEKHEILWNFLKERIERLNMGKERMVTSAGVVLVPDAETSGIDTHEGYQPTTSMLDYLDQGVDPDLIQAEVDRRE